MFDLTYSNRDLRAVAAGYPKQLSASSYLGLMHEAILSLRLLKTILKSYFAQRMCETSYWMKSLFVAVGLLASWLSLNAEGSESPWTGAGGPELSSLRPVGRVETPVGRDKKGKIICKAVYAPMPIYRTIAWGRNEGRGLFLLSLRPNGTVSAIVIERSTGLREIDTAAKEALMKWRFQVITGVTRVHIPVNFTRR